jgi:primosomal protein N' (replication factor Y)
MIAKVVVDVAVDKEFDYLIPESLTAQIKLGSRVKISFGARQTQGYVVGFANESGRTGLKAIDSVVGDKPFIDEKLLKLARWMGEYYCAPVELAVQAVLPGAVRNHKAGFKEQLFVEMAGGIGFGVQGSGFRDDGSQGGGMAEGREQRAEVGKIKAPKQDAALAVLAKARGMFLQDLVKLSGADAASVRALERKGLVRIIKQTSMRDPLSQHTILKTIPPELMAEQAAALKTIYESIDHLKPPVILLHGVTGSGKTEVYLQAIEHALKQDRGAIVLVPEISLTPQTIERFQGRFGGAIAVLHSHLSDGERHDEWHRIHNGEARIVIGARSAVFAPVRNLGLIVVDEEHENTYKQEESPRYNARDVAVMRGHLEGCSVLLGSATPALESFHNAKKGKYRLVEMRHRVDHRSMPGMQVVDMRLEAERTGKVSVFSGELIRAVQARLDKGEQVMLFLNRRGYATSLVCPKCGYVSACDQCSISMTYHRQVEMLKCHVCGDARRVPERCPGCQDPAYKLTGVGTQRVEAVVGKLFPGARVARMDADATARKGAHHEILGEFRTGKIDILVGTQMIAKGLDFPNVTLIGVLNADTSLHMPDFRAGERTFQLLTQVAGDVAGEVIVQTFTPFHQAVQAARRLDYDGFTDKELEYRRELGYPPFGHLVCMGVKGAVLERVQGAVDKFAAQLKPLLAASVILAGPAPAPLERAKGQYRFQIILRAPSTKAILDVLKPTLRGYKWPAGVTASVDVDAMSVM